VLIANRGEIAVRIVRSCRRLGCRSVAVYSDADRDALHVQVADHAEHIGGAPATESYLRIDRILAAAERSGADAVHPGYGFLAEREEFARAVQASGLAFIGPDATSIALMGDKARAKQLSCNARVPTVPGYDGDDQSDEALSRAALTIGLPVMIKAAAGGGGRGMRRVESESALMPAIASARTEALRSFGEGRLLVERAIDGARHVEVQIFGDQFGNVVHLGERECSVQRRHQKIVEETPCAAVDESLRARLGAAAVAAARAVRYCGAGTVEFLLAPDGRFYFMEMNTRLQVEHAVTEMVYGVDLVEWQLRVACGEELPLNQRELLDRRSGWAIEARLCAEDPGRNFLPRAGTITRWSPGGGESVRVDHGVLEGQAVTPYYDSLQAKLIAHGRDREQARRRLLKLLEDTVFEGVGNNREFLMRVIEHPEFVAGHTTTDFIARHLQKTAAPVHRREAGHETTLRS
jgi:geranyl-CoA carboxylase alpha subunit